MHLVLQCVTFLLVLFCPRNMQEVSADVRLVRSTCPPLADDSYFFPASSDPSAPLAVSLHQFHRRWYSAHLRAMGEPSLSCGTSSDEEVYRFLWLRTFDHPIIVRIARSEKRVQLTAVELSGRGGYEPGSILKQMHKSLSSDQWQELTDRIGAVDYWLQPSIETGGIGLDGSQWIIEARCGPIYHVVDRWSGGMNEHLGLLFLELADLKPDKIY